MAKPVEIMDEADAEADEAADWYLDIDEQLASDFTEEYAAAIEYVGEHSNAFPAYLHGTKRYLFKRFEYQLVIRELLDRVQVIAVAHLRRKPGYWKKRLKQPPRGLA
jgi:toxin ParE1/3/4